MDSSCPLKCDNQHSLMRLMILYFSRWVSMVTFNVLRDDAPLDLMSDPSLEVVNIRESSKAVDV